MAKEGRDSALDRRAAGAASWPFAGLVLAASLFCRPAAADLIELRPDPPDRAGFLQVLYRLDSPVTQRAILSLEWTDTLGRLVERRQVPIGPGTGRTVAFRLAMRRAVTVGNMLRGRISPTAEGSVRETVLPFIVRPPPQAWRDWQIIAYQPQDPVRLAALARIGVTAGKVLANRDDTARPSIVDAVTPFVQQNLRWYVENIATDFYAAYHRWLADRPVNAAFRDVQSRHRQDPADKSVFVRQPGLSDVGWLKKIHDRLLRTVQDHAPYQPLYYSLADEPGIGDLAAAWDFDLSPNSLAGMRVWLRSQYGSLDALNRQWGANFAHWNAVMPMTTDQAMQRGDDNFSAWADFKAWMDVAFARAVRYGTEAVHAADPHALAAIEGAQIPGWGGYDYTRLPHSVDVMEIYDAGENVDIARALDPSLVMLTTSSGGAPAQTRALWRAVLQGIRGVILWDENGDLVREDGSLGPWGRQAAPLFAELRSGLGALLINSRPAFDGVAMLYSPASLRVQWMLDRRSQGAAWADRDAEAENQDNTSRAAMRFFTRLVRHMGVEARFLSPALVAQGALRHQGIRVLILPRSVALSADEAAEIHRFVAQGGTVIADVVPGIFDQHGRRLPRAALAALFAAGQASGRGHAVLYPLDHQPPETPAGVDADALSRLRALFARAGVQPAIKMTANGRSATDGEIYRYHIDGSTIVAVLRDLPQDVPSPPETLALTLPHPFVVEDLNEHHGRDAGGRLTVAADPLRPVLFALSPAPSPAPVISAPATGEAGRDAWFSIRMPGIARDGMGILDVSVIDPTGRAESRYGGDLLAPGGRLNWRLPLAVNDPAGKWQISFTNVVGMRRTIAHIDVAAAAP